MPKRIMAMPIFEVEEETNRNTYSCDARGGSNMNCRSKYAVTVSRRRGWNRFKIIRKKI